LWSGLHSGNSSDEKRVSNTVHLLKRFPIIRVHILLR